MAPSNRMFARGIAPGATGENPTQKINGSLCASSQIRGKHSALVA